MHYGGLWLPTPLRIGSPFKASHGRRRRGSMILDLLDPEIVLIVQQMVGMKQMEVFRTKIVNQKSCYTSRNWFKWSFTNQNSFKFAITSWQLAVFFFRFQSRASRGVPQRQVGWLLFLHAATTMDSQVPWYPQIIHGFGDPPFLRNSPYFFLWDCNDGHLKYIEIWIHGMMKPWYDDNENCLFVS